MDFIDAFTNRRQTKYFRKDKIPSKELIQIILERTVSLTPSKQNIMPYKIIVLGPDKVKEKEALFRMAEGSDTPHEYEENKNIQVFAPYVFVYTMRLAFPNDHVFQLKENGYDYPACNPDRYFDSTCQQTASIEIGMSSTILTYLCRRFGLDIGYLLCFKKWGYTKESIADRSRLWSEITCVDEPPIFICGVGYKERDVERNQNEGRPDTDEIIQWA